MIFSNLLKRTVVGTHEKIKQFRDFYFSFSLKKIRNFYNVNMLPPLRLICQHFDPALSNATSLNTDTNSDTHNSVVPDYSSTLGLVLISACKDSQTDLAIQLINDGADVNATNTSGYTPLIYACFNSLDDVATELIIHGANVNATASNGSYPLWCACINNNIALCKFLLDNGSKLNDVPTKIKYPSYLSFWRNLDIVQLLLNHASNINWVNNEFDDVCLGLNPLWYSCFHAHWDIAELLVDYGANVNIHCFGISPLALACTWGNIDVVDLLLKHNADIHNTGLGSNALHWACTGYDNIDLVRTFLDRGIDVDQRTVFNITPLHLSCSFNIDSISCFLIDRGANVNAKTSFDITPLALACLSSEMKKTIVKLISNGADIDAKSFLGTPLSIACENGFDFAVSQLLTLGANVKIDDLNDGSIIVKAIEGNLEYSSIVSLIKRVTCIDSLLDDESVILFKKDNTNGSVKNSLAASAIMQYFRLNTSHLALSVDVAHKSAHKFVLALEMFSDLWLTLKKAQKRTRNNTLVTSEFKFLLDSYQDFTASQLVRLLSINKFKKYTDTENHQLDRSKVINLTTIRKIQHSPMIR